MFMWTCAYECDIYTVHASIMLGLAATSCGRVFFFCRAALILLFLEGGKGRGGWGLRPHLQEVTGARSWVMLAVS